MIVISALIILWISGFDGHRDTPFEALHCILLGVVKYLYRDAIASVPSGQHSNLYARWASFDTRGLYCAPVQPVTMVQYARSLVGKEFRVVLQAAPFVLFEYISPEHRQLWTLSAHLSSYIFQHEITNKAEYLAELKTLVDRFLAQIIKMTAQWSNKPKLHMLTHLAYSIERFGPAILFATEIFESFNGVLRAASVHTNRHSPGRDIATSFLDDNLLRVLVTGASFEDSKLNIRTCAGPKVLEVFEAPAIQKGLGWNPDWDKATEISARCKGGINSTFPIPKMPAHSK